MIYGLCGAASTGKTTLGKAVADFLDITFLPTSITECARKHGYDAVSNLPLTRRLDLQRHLLDDHIEMITQAKMPIITDRTPIDMIAYLMGEVFMNSAEYYPNTLFTAMDGYVQDCLQAARKYYDSIYLLSRLPVYEVRDSRPSENTAYQRHCDLIMKGALVDLNGKVDFSVIAAETLDWRIDRVSEQIAQRLDLLDSKRRTTRHVN